MINGYGLSFGVPLEDIFPEGDVHPIIKDLLNQAIKSIANEEHTMNEIINFLQGSLKMRLILKEKLQSPKRRISISQIPPGAFLWALRHFLGLLPLPVLPSYANGQHFQWDVLAELSTIELKESFRIRKNREKICRQIFESFNRLPASNFLLVYNILNFLRRLSVWPKGEPHICKNSVQVLVKYFSSAMFLRPFRPGYTTYIDKKYYPLTAVLILYWPNIRRLCRKIKHSHLCSVSSCGGTLAYYHSIPACNYGCKIDKSTQTTFVENIERITVMPSANLSLSNTNTGYETNKKNNGCCYAYNHYCHYSPPFQIFHHQQCEKPTYFKQTITFKPSTHSCTCSLNCERFKTTIDNVQQQFDDKDDKNENTEASLASAENTSVSPKTDSCGGEYIYDEYNEQCTYDKPILDQNDRSEEPVDILNENNVSEHNDILDKISKIGWTYTAKENSISDSAKPEDTDLSCYASPLIGWTIPKDNYNIYFDDKLSNKISLDNKDVDEADQLKANINKSPVSEKQISPISTSRSHKSLMSLRGVKSKFAFLKMFSPKLIKAKKTSSEEQVSSKIKYTKMDSARSTMF